MVQWSRIVERSVVEDQVIQFAVAAIVNYRCLAISLGGGTIHAAGKHGVATVIRRLNHMPIAKSLVKGANRQRAMRKTWFLVKKVEESCPRFRAPAFRFISEVLESLMNLPWGANVGTVRDPQPKLMQ